MAKLDPVKIQHTTRGMAGGEVSDRAAVEMEVSGRRVRRPYARYRATGEIPEPGRPGRPRQTTPEERLRAAEEFGRHRCGAARLEMMDASGGTHVPHNAIRAMQGEAGLAAESARGQRRRKWVRYGRTRSGSMWHTDYKQLEGGRRLAAYMGDASRFITGYGVFERATGANAISVLDGAIGRHGRPTAVLTDRGSRFYANEAENRRGASEFEQEMVRPGIRRLLCRASHPQTNGKLERFHGEIDRKMRRFRDIDGFVGRWDDKRPHMSPDYDSLETPALAFKKKMPEKDTTVADAQTGYEYGVR